LESVGGDIEFGEQNPNDPLSKFTFLLRKEYFEPNESLDDDDTAIDLIYTQLINNIISGDSSCGFEGGVTALATHFYVSSNGKIETDFVTKLFSFPSFFFFFFFFFFQTNFLNF